MGRLPFTIAAMLILSGISLAQASRPKVADTPPVQETATPLTVSTPATAAPAISSARTVTGRPADLDPRILWLDELQMPQSGGPEPLVKVRELRVPIGGSIQDVVECDKDLVLFVSGRKLIVFRTDVDGNIKWTYELKGGIIWTVLGDGRKIYVVPLCAPEEVGPLEDILVLEQTGEIAGRIKWPLLSKKKVLRWIVLDKGLIVGEYADGRRIHARIDPKSTVDPDDILTVGDVGVGGEDTREIRKKNYRAGYAVLGAEPVDWDYDRASAAKLNKKRRERADKWRGHKLWINRLPGYDPSAADKQIARGDWWKPETFLGRTLALEPDGSVWMDFGIHNPFHLSQGEMDELDEKRETGRMARSGIALFAPDGHLRGYMITPCLPHHVEGAAYLECGQVLARVEPMKAK